MHTVRKARELKAKAEAYESRIIGWIKVQSFYRAVYPANTKGSIYGFDLNTGEFTMNR